MKDGPMFEHINRSTEGMIKAEYVTYTVKDGQLVKETSIRQFQKSGDYHDSFLSDPLVEVK
jgi:hypothetical protein